jgi:small subunit ribosomal protein S20
MAAGAISPPLFFERCRAFRANSAPTGILQRTRKHISASIASLQRRGRQARPAAVGTCRRIFEEMANTTSAKKATRKIARRTVVNKARRTKLRTAVRTVEEAIKIGDRNAAVTAMKRAEPELMKAAQHNIIHRNNANRKVSRLTHQIAKLGK